MATKQEEDGALVCHSSEKPKLDNVNNNMVSQTLGLLLVSSQFTIHTSTSIFHLKMSEQDFSEDQSDPDYWSVSSSVGGNDHTQLHSMTAKGVKYLCSELVELKRESDEDFQKNVRENYLLFFGISEGVKSLESELMLLKLKAATHKNLLGDLTNKIVLQYLQETLHLTYDDTSLSNFSSPGKLEAHTEHITGILYTLLSEHRFDEALCVLEQEEESSQIMLSDEDVSANEIMLYNTVITDQKDILVHQLTLLAENPRVPATELQKALMGLTKLGKTDLATQLLLKYYHERIACGLYKFYCSNSFIHGVQFRDVSRYTFSMISQAVRSYVALHGETSIYPAELVQWTCEETEVFVSYFTKYVASVSETRNGLSTVVEAVHFAMSYCSLLESQRIIVLPSLIKYIRPHIEEVLQTHTNHYKNIISIVASTDTWTLEKYHISGVLTRDSSLVLSQHLEYCLLTDSGWKFITLLQVFADDASPLVALHMEGSVLRGLVDMLTQYIIILEKVLVDEVTAEERAYKAVPLVERVTILANLETTMKLFSCIVEDICGSFSNMRHEIDSSGLSTQGSLGRLRACYCQQFIHRFLFPEPNDKALSYDSTGLHENSGTSYLDPYSGYQEMYFEVRRLQKISEENHIEVHWLINLLKELMETVFLCISTDTSIFSIAEDLSMDQHCINFMQFALNVKFLEEIARQGGYLSNNTEIISKQIVSRAETVFSSAGIDPRRHIRNDDWASNAAAKALQKLQDLEMRESLAYEITSESDKVFDAEHEYSSDSSAKINSASTVSSQDSDESYPIVEQEAFELINTTGTVTFDGVVSPEGQVDMETKSTGFGSNVTSSADN